MSSWCPGRAGKQIHAEELVRPSVRGFVGTIPDVLAVVERHSTSPKGQSPPGRRGDRRGRRADRRLRHLTQPGSHLLATRTDEPAHGSRSPSGSACKPTGQGRHRTVDSGTSCGSVCCGLARVRSSLLRRYEADPTRSRRHGDGTGEQECYRPDDCRPPTEVAETACVLWV